MSCPRAKTKPLICLKESKAQYDVKNELADLKVECLNKNKTIQDQEKHIEDIKEEIIEITKRFRELNEKSIADEEQYRRDIESMVNITFIKLIKKKNEIYLKKIILLLNFFFLNTKIYFLGEITAGSISESTGEA